MRLFHPFVPQRRGVLRARFSSSFPETCRGRWVISPSGRRTPRFLPRGNSNFPDIVPVIGKP